MHLRSGPTTLRHWGSLATPAGLWKSVKEDAALGSGEMIRLGSREMLRLGSREMIRLGAQWDVLQTQVVAESGWVNAWSWKLRAGSRVGFGECCVKQGVYRFI